MNSHLDLERLLADAGLPTTDAAVVPSAKRFPDGGQFRVEIPSTEGPACLDAVLEESERLDVPVHRVSQGSGVLMLADDELREMGSAARARAVEVSLFARPGAAWGTSAAARTAGAFAAPAFGWSQLRAGLDDCLRAAQFGFRSVLIADIGVLDLFRRARESGVLPADMQAKSSVMLPAANPASARVLEALGASTINIPPDLPLAEIATIRDAVEVPLDLYVEAPDNVGGFVRLHEIPELVRVAAPVYLKFGLRNSPDIYPTGRHLERVAIDMSRERVRRARLGLELLSRRDPELKMSEIGADDLAVPVAASAVKAAS